MRKFLGVVAVAGLAVALAAGPAFAHECYNTSRSTKGNQQIAAHSPSFVTFDAVAMGFLTGPPEEGGPGLCEAGAQWLIDQIHAASQAGTLDFGTIEAGIDAGAPKFMEWYAAYGLMVTLIWLYITLLRLLALVARNQ